MKIAALVTVILLLLPAGVSAGETLRLEDVRLGETVAGDPVSPYDLEGRVVVFFNWCVSCPMSTGAFPYVNRIAGAYADRGVAVVGIQVHREPEVAENDVVWYLEHLRPVFPVTRLGWVRDWPQQWLPWVSVFDAGGEEVYAGGLDRLEAVLDETLAGSPDPLVGGPYRLLADRAAAIAKDRERPGPHLAEIRALAEKPDADPEMREEARRILLAVEKAFARREAKAARDSAGVVETAEIYARLAAAYEGDAFGERAAKCLAAIRSAPGFAEEEEAWRALAAARADLRRMPPPGGYVYHPTEMNYLDSSDPALRDRRARMLAEFRLELARIEREHPATDAGLLAGDLLFVYDPVPLDDAASKERLERAAKLLGEKPAPLAVHEARLVLVEVAEGRPGKDPAAVEAKSRLSSLETERAADLAAGGTRAREIHAAVRAILAEVEAGGGALPRERADEIVARLKAAAAEAPTGGELRRRVAAFVRALDESYAGPARLGVSFEAGYEGPGVRIAGVGPSTAASVAGLAPGDVILRFAGEAVSGAEALAAAISARHPGDRVVLAIRRGGEEREVEVVLGRP